MTHPFIICLLIIFVLGFFIFMFKYLNGDFNYKDSVFHIDKNRGIVTIKREYDNGHIDFIQKKLDL